MTLIDTTGTSLVTYRGTGMVLVQEDSSTVLCRGYYEAAQFPSGALNVSFVPTQRPRGAMGAHSRSMPCNLTFSGESLGGSSLHSSGEPLFSRNAWLLSPAWRPPTELTFLPAFLRVRQRGQASVAYAKSRFLVSNFLWHDQDAREPDSLLLDMQGFRVTIDPTPDYLDTARRLGQLGGHDAGAPWRVPRSRRAASLRLRGGVAPRVARAAPPGGVQARPPARLPALPHGPPRRVGERTHPVLPEFPPLPLPRAPLSDLQAWVCGHRRGYLALHQRLVRRQPPGLRVVRRRSHGRPRGAHGPLPGVFGVRLRPALYEHP